MYRRLNTSGTVFFLFFFFSFWLYSKSSGVKSFRKESKGRSGGDGQVHILLFWRWRRYGNVIVLFLRASCSWQGRAFAVMWSSPLAAALSLLFVLNSAVLEPDFYLFLRQVQVRGDLNAPESGEVHVRGELSFQLQKLCAGEGGAHALAALKFAVTVFWENNINCKPRGYCENKCNEAFVCTRSILQPVSTYRWRCSGTAAGLEPSTQPGKSPVHGWGWCCWMKSVALTEPSGSTVSWREETMLWEAAASVEMDEAGTRSCTAGRSTRARLSSSGRSPAARAHGAASVRRTGIEVGCSRFLCRLPPLKSRNPREKTSAWLQTCCSACLKV